MLLYELINIEHAKFKEPVLKGLVSFLGWCAIHYTMYYEVTDWNRFGGCDLFWQHNTLRFYMHRFIIFLRILKTRCEIYFWMQVKLM